MTERTYPHGMRSLLLGVLLLTGVGCGGGGSTRHSVDVSSPASEAAADAPEEGNITEAANSIDVRVVDTSVARQPESVGDSEERGLALCASTRVAVDVQEAPLSRVLARLAAIAPLRLETDWQVNDEVGEASVHAFSFEGPLNVTLSLLTRGFGLIAIYTDDRVLVTRPEYASVVTTEHWYAIPEAVAEALQGFIPPTIQLVGPDDVIEDLGWGCGDLEPVLPYTEDYVAEMVKHAIEPDYWRVPDFSVDLVGHQLRVRSTSRIHRAVGEFLASMSAPPQSDAPTEEPRRD